MRKLAVSLAVLIVLLVAADFGLRYFATKQIGDAIATKFGLTASPEVSIAGFPFVVQAVNGEYDTISVNLPDVQLGQIRGVLATVDLLGVRIPLSDAVKGDTSALTAAGTRVRVSIPIAALAAAVNLPDLDITGNDDGSLRAAGTVTVLGQAFRVAGDLTATVADSTVQLRSGTLSGNGTALPPEALQAVGSLLTLDIPLTALPFGVTEASVTVAGGNLIISGTTSEIDFGALQQQR